jgi:DNA mismatch repair protein MutS2
MKCYPESALVQMEFDKVQTLLAALCKTEWAKNQAETLRIHTRKDFIDPALLQTHEYKQLLQSGQYFPNEFTAPIDRELKLLGIPGAMLSGEEFTAIRKLADNTRNVFRWFDNERRIAWPGLCKVIEHTYYEKTIIEMMDAVLDEFGNVKDNATPELQQIRMSLYRKRNELRRVFDRLVQKMSKNGYLADIEESFMNGRRVVAVFAEQKRTVKGILHGESDTRRTTFIEPEETIELNNDIFSLENEERSEIYRILKTLTAQLSVYAPLLRTYYEIAGTYDFIRAKGLLAIDMNAHYPGLQDKSGLHLVKAVHPLLYLYNKKAGKPTIPVTLTLDEKSHILVISGPNAGGKTVTMKTVGLQQLMIQAGLLVPADPTSQFGIFKQLLIHIGDTQSIEFELSTYSSHLRNMKHFMENASGRTLFFIDELGSGSDPNLGGAFAEVIMEELAFKHAYGIVTTHYLNLKVMANKVKGIMNGAMAFDEKKLEPLYQLLIGKPGSSYTFSIAERIGMNPKLIQKARSLADEDQFLLDKLLNRTEQDLRRVEAKEKDLHQLVKENEKLKKEMEQVLDKEKHRQQVEVLKEQNRIKEEQLTYLKEMERKLKQIVHEWKKTDDKNKVLKQAELLLFQQKQQQVNQKIKKKFDTRFAEVKGDIAVGVTVKMKKNHQVGVVKEIRGKKAVVQIGLMPMTVDMDTLTLVVEKPPENEQE